MGSLERCLGHHNAVVGDDANREAVQAPEADDHRCAFRVYGLGF